MLAFEFALIGFLVVTAGLVAIVRDPIGATAVFAAFSLGLAIIWVWLAAPDVGLTEAAVGAGVMVFLLLIAAVQTSEDGIYTGGFRWRSINGSALLVVTAVALLLAITVIDFPKIGDLDAPAVRETDATGAGSPYAAYIGDPAMELGIPNTVATVLTIFRSLDTLGEVVVAFSAVIGVLIIFGRTHITADPDRSTQARQIVHADPEMMSPVGMTAVRLVMPLVFVFGIYLTVQGTVQPGGGFQGGIVLGSAFVLMALIFGHRATAEWLDEGILVWIVVLGMGTILLLVGGMAIIGVASDGVLYPIAPVYIADLIEIGIGMAVGSVVIGLVVAMALGLDIETGGDRQ